VTSVADRPYRTLPREASDAPRSEELGAELTDGDLGQGDGDDAEEADAEPERLVRPGSVRASSTVQPTGHQWHRTVEHAGDGRVDPQLRDGEEHERDAEPDHADRRDARLRSGAREISRRAHAREQRQREVDRARAG
jgi:hypothetical protein